MHSSRSYRLGVFFKFMSDACFVLGFIAINAGFFWLLTTIDGPFKLLFAGVILLVESMLFTGFYQSIRDR